MQLMTTQQHICNILIPLWYTVPCNATKYHAVLLIAMNFHAMSSIIASSIFLPKDFHPKPIQFTAKSFLVCCLSSQFARLNFLSPSLSEIFFARDKFPETKLSLFIQDWAVHTDGNVKDFFGSLFGNNQYLRTRSIGNEMWRAVIIFIILYLVTINIWCRGETHELSQLFTVAGCKRQSAERAADLEIIHNSQPVAHVGAHLALGMDEGVNSSIVLKLPGVQLNRPRAGRLVDFFCRVRAQDKLKYCQPGFAPRLYLLQLPAQHRSHPLKLFPFNVQQRRSQFLKPSKRPQPESASSPSPRCRASRPPATPALSLWKQKLADRHNGGRSPRCKHLKQVSTPARNVLSIVKQFCGAVTWSWPGCRPWGAPSRRRGGCCAASCQAPSCWLASPDVQVLINMFSFNQWESKKESWPHWGWALRRLVVWSAHSFHPRREPQWTSSSLHSLSAAPAIRRWWETVFNGGSPAAQQASHSQRSLARGRSCQEGGWGHSWPPSKELSRFYEIRLRESTTLVLPAPPYQDRTTFGWEESRCGCRQCVDPIDWWGTDLGVTEQGYRFCSHVSPHLLCLQWKHVDHESCWSCIMLIMYHDDDLKYEETALAREGWRREPMKMGELQSMLQCLQEQSMYKKVVCLF